MDILTQYGTQLVLIAAAFLADPALGWATTAAIVAPYQVDARLCISYLMNSLLLFSQPLSKWKIN